MSPAATGTGPDACRRTGPPDSSTDPLERAWATTYAEYMVGRRARIQSAAQSWLSVLTSLISFFSAALVVGSPAVNDLGPVPARIAVFATACVILVLAMSAIVQAALATFGGLSVGTTKLPDGRLERWVA